ncbi:hypothetical protein HAX54_014867 [Datura stramonium]|uniref:Integrase core domain containing protein n=1 Tax=Datura stramonium TaxID=4076 RepID=A0ABS8TNV3_DATST|nr:hypothetical protein [Datura stramonium]
MQPRIPVLGEMVDILEATITRMLYGPNFMTPASTTEFDYRMREWHQQHRWLAQVLTDGQPSWLTNPKERIVKSTLTFVAKFWWAVVRLRLLLTGGDNTLAKDKAVPMTNLMSSCREALVTTLAGIDVETYATKKYDLEKSKDESKYDLKLHKPIPEVFKSSGQTIKATKTTNGPAGAATGTELVYHAAPISTSTPSTSGAAVTQPRMESAETSSFMPQSSWIFVDRAIIDALELYKNLHARIDDMEARVNDRMKSLTMPDLARFEDSEEDVPFIYLFGEQPKETGKFPRDSAGDGAKSHKKKHKKEIEAHATGATVSLESQTLITQPPAAEATVPNTLSALVTAGVADEVPEATSPYTVVPDSGA